jgi:hypothetical protein
MVNRAESNAAVSPAENLLRFHFQKIEHRLFLGRDCAEIGPDGVVEQVASQIPEDLGKTGDNHRAPGAGNHQVVGKGGYPPHVIQVGMRYHRQFDLFLLFLMENRADRARIQKNTAVDEKGGGIESGHLGPGAAQHTNLHSIPSPWARRNASTTIGSNWRPLQRESSANAWSKVSAFRYGRSVVMASKVSATATMRAASGIRRH